MGAGTNETNTTNNVAAATLPIYPSRVTMYAITIYINGTNRLVKEEGKFSGVADGYYKPVEQYAAKNFTEEQINIARGYGYITLQQWEETMSYRTTPTTT